MRLLLLALALLLSACAPYYESPTEGPLAHLLLNSKSDYGGVAVDYCLDAECKKIKPIVLLAGSQFIARYPEGSAPEIFTEREWIEIDVTAGQETILRFTAEKTVITFGDEPHYEFQTWDLSELGAIYVQTRVSYIESEEKLRCETFIGLNPKPGSSLLIVHNQDDSAENCSATISER